LDDLFLNVLEIGDRGAPPLDIQGVRGHGLDGAVVKGEAAVVFATREEALRDAEVTLPDLPSAFLLVLGLVPGAHYDLQLTSAFAPGSPVWRGQGEADESGVIQTAWNGKDGRLRVHRLEDRRGR
jgi:hypothetical protein